LKDNVKARILDKKLSNEYIHNKEECRSQIETYRYLKAKTKKK
jgi:polyphosphate kinase